MKHGKKILRLWILLFFGLVAGGLWLTGNTWAWPTVSDTHSGQITMGTVAYELQVLLEETAVPADGELAPGKYTVSITATGDTEGWFLLRVSSPEDESKTVYYRTENMQPEQAVSFVLELTETAELTLKSRWDVPQEGVAVLSEDAEIRWGTGEPEETEVTEPEEETEVTEVTEPEEETEVTEVTEPEEETEVTEVTEPEEETEVTEVTEPEEVTEVTEVTEPEEETEVTEVTEPEEETEATEVTEPEEESSAPQSTEATQQNGTPDA